LATQTTAKWWIEEGRNLPGINGIYLIDHWAAEREKLIAKETKEKELTKLKSSKPKQPAILTKALSNAPDWAYWNRAVYGSKDYISLCIYIADNKIPLTEKQAQELETYATSLVTWEKQMKETQKKD